MAGEIGKKEITVEVGGQKYEFRIPSIHDDIKVGTKAKALLRKLDPEWDGEYRGLDYNSQFQVRLCATFEVLLLRASTGWPFNGNPSQGTVNVDTSLWQPEDVGRAGEVYLAFSEKLAIFRAGGNPSADPAKPEDLAGKSDTGSQPV